MSLKFIVSVGDDTSWQNVIVKAPPLTLCVVDVFSEWCGPCTALDHKLQQLHVDLVGCDIKYIQAMSNRITALSNHSDRSMPLFLFYKEGKQVDELQGANQVELTRKIKQLCVMKEECEAVADPEQDAR